MENPKIKTVSINDLREWNNKEELVLVPKFQRRSVWTPKARFYLIDTILNGFPIPSIQIRQKINLDTQRTIREVVDGQQRIRAILDYLNDDFPLSKIHNKKYGGFKFSELPKQLKKKFLNYDLPMVLLIGASNSDVLEVFSRINSYTITLNSQEKLNAKFNGRFKQTVFKLARDHLEFWNRNKILTHRKIMRMKDSELCSDLVIAMIDGIQAIGKIKVYFKDYDDDFPQEEIVNKRFKRCIDIIAELYRDDLKKSQFRNTTLFYSLFCAIYDLVYGLSPFKEPRLKVKSEDYKLIRKALLNLEGELESERPTKKKYLDFKNAANYHTTNINERNIRHKVIVDEIIKELRR